MDGSAFWTAVGGAALAAIGFVIKRIAERLKKRDQEKEITQSARAELDKIREARPWQAMEAVQDDLVEALGRLSAANRNLQADNDRLREERDRARLEATDWEIAARRASALVVRVSDLELELKVSRSEHQHEVSHLREDLERRDALIDELRQRRGSGPLA